MKRTYIYHEGEKAKRNFERGMKALFKAPKTVRVGGASAKGKKTSRKSEREGKSE